MNPLPWRIMVAMFSAAIGFTFILDRIKLRITAKIKIE